MTASTARRFSLEAKAGLLVTAAALAGVLFENIGALAHFMTAS